MEVKVTFGEASLYGPVILDKENDSHLDLAFGAQPRVDLINFWISRAQYFRNATDDSKLNHKSRPYIFFVGCLCDVD